MVQSCEWFALLNNQERSLLLSSLSQTHFNTGDTIVKQGFSAPAILFLESGVVKLNVEHNGKGSTFKIISKGNFIGLMCSFVNKRLDFSAIAAAPSVVTMIDRAIFESLIRDNGIFAVYIVKMMSNMTNSVVHNMITLSHKNVVGSVASLLLDMTEVFNSNVFMLPFTREELANSLGYSKESVINTLSDFQRDGIIDIKAKRVEITDLNQLINISING